MGKRGRRHGQRKAGDAGQHLRAVERLECRRHGVGRADEAVNGRAVRNAATLRAKFALSASLCAQAACDCVRFEIVCSVRYTISEQSPLNLAGKRCLVTNAPSKSFLFVLVTESSTSLLRRARRGLSDRKSQREIAKKKVSARELGTKTFGLNGSLDVAQVE